MNTTANATTARPTASRDGAKLLRRSLRIDGWGTAGFGVVMLVGGGWLSEPLGLPAALFVPVGIVLLAAGVGLGLIGRHPTIPTGLALAAIAVNALSGVVILSVMVSGVLPLTTLGIAFMVVGALWVAAFAVIEAVGLRRATRQ